MIFDQACERVLKTFQAGLALLCQEKLEARRFALAFSGGVDSTVLLHAAVSCLGAHRCVALHVHHGLNVQADHWQTAAQALSERLGVRFVARRVTIDTSSGQGVEAAAREARYAALSDLCAEEGASVLLLGHHADDQAETVLLQLLRGAGLPGIAAMPEKPVERIWLHTWLHAWPRTGSAFAEYKTEVDKADVKHNAIRNTANVPRRITWLRPFLSITREAIQAYAIAHDLCWNEDDSNADVRYARNALRHDVLPHIEKHFPTYRSACARMARYAAQAQGLLDDLAQIDLQSLSSVCTGRLDKALVLSHQAFNALLNRSFARAVNVLRYWMRIEHIPPAAASWLEEACRQLDKGGALQQSVQPSPALIVQPSADASKSTAWQIRHKGFCLSIYRDNMHWEYVGVAKRLKASTGADTLTLQWQGENEWALLPWRGKIHFIQTSQNDPASVPATLLRSGPLIARKRCGGERLRLHRGSPSRTLKKCFQEAGVPAWQRDVPVLYVGKTLLFVPYIGLNLGDIPLIGSESADFVRLEWCPEPL